MKKKQIKGLTNRTKIIHNSFVKKSRRASDYYINRINEQNFYQQAQDWDFIKIPTSIKKNWSGKWISQMTYFPEAKTLSQINLTPKKLQEVIRLINKLHHQKADLVVFNPRKFLEQFTKKIGILEELRPLKKIINQIMSSYFLDGKKLVISHNDLIKDNFLIINQKMYLIDFEYASLNHPLFDYASFITESLSKSQAKEFEKMLNLTDKERDKLHQIALYQDFLWAHWGAYLYRRTKKEIYRKIKIDKVKNAWRRVEEYRFIYK